MDEKSIEAAVGAGVEEWHHGGPVDNAIRAAIAAYRDAEIERLTAENAMFAKTLFFQDKTLADLRAKLEAAERDARRECLWVDDDDCGVWEGSCGVAWTFIDAGPAENGMKHCPQCGGHLTLDEAEREGEQ